MSVHPIIGIYPMPLPPRNGGIVPPYAGGSPVPKPPKETKR